MRFFWARGLGLSHGWELAVITAEGLVLVWRVWWWAVLLLC